MKVSDFINSVRTALRLLPLNEDGSFPAPRFSSDFGHLHLDFSASTDYTTILMRVQDTMLVADARGVFCDFSFLAFKNTLTFPTPKTLEPSSIADILNVRSRADVERIR